jgi:hypothetical protein
MPDMDTLVARDQAMVLGGLTRRVPEGNFNPVEFLQVDVLFCARHLAGKGSDFIFGKWARELDPMTTVVGCGGEVLGL